MIKEKIRSHYQQVKSFYDHYERWLMPAMLVGGLAFDFFTFKHLEIHLALQLLALHFVISGSAAAFIYFYDAQRLSQHFRYIRLLAPLVFQFSFGALLNASFIFYWFSGSFSVSWPFILVVTLLMISNDLFKHYYLKPIIQISVYFFIALSISTLELSFIFNSVDVWVFLVSCAASLLFITLYTYGLARFLEPIRQQRRAILVSVGIICAAMNVLYFYNVIPPIPLALRDAGVYHQIKRSGAGYVVQAEKEQWWERFLPGTTIHLPAGERAYVYTSIFAPGDLDATIFHNWQHYDPVANKWLNTDNLSFIIAGGRQDGYRGYSFKTNLSAGLWRVDVKTKRGQVIGRVRFNVKIVSQAPELVSLTR